MAQPQLSQRTTITISIFEPKLNAVIPITNTKNILDVTVAMLNGLTDSFHSLVAQLLTIRQFMACDDRSIVASNAFERIEINVSVAYGNKITAICSLTIQKISVVCPVSEGQVQEILSQLNLSQKMIKLAHSQKTTDIVNACRNRAEDCHNTVCKQYRLYLDAVKFFVPCID